MRASVKKQMLYKRAETIKQRAEEVDSMVRTDFGGLVKETIETIDMALMSRANITRINRTLDNIEKALSKANDNSIDKVDVREYYPEYSCYMNGEEAGYIRRVYGTSKRKTRIFLRNVGANKKYPNITSKIMATQGP